MQGPVRHVSQLPHSRRLESRIKPPAQAFTQNGYELQKKRTPVCAQEGTRLTHRDTGSTSCSCSRTLLKSRSQLALALAGPGSMISLFGKLQWSNSSRDSESVSAARVSDNSSPPGIKTHKLKSITGPALNHSDFSCSQI